MEWWLAVIIGAVFVNIAGTALRKKLSDKLPKKKAIGVFWQYFFCTLFAVIIFFLLFPKQEIDPWAIQFVLIVGIINGVGNYAEWQALGQSMSKTALLDPVIAFGTIVPAVIFLSEWELWDLQLFAGAACCFLAILFFSWTGQQSTTKVENIRKWLIFGAILVITNVITGYLLKVFSFTVPKTMFLVAFYLGSLIAAIAIQKLEGTNPIEQVSKTMIVPCGLLALFTLMATGGMYWSYQLGGPVSIVQPFFNTLVPIGTISVGLIVFKERKGLTTKEKLGIAIGIIGILLVAL